MEIMALILLDVLLGVILIGISLILLKLKRIEDLQIDIHRENSKLISNELYHINEFLETIIKDQNKIKRYLEMIDIKFDKLKKEIRGI